MSFTQEWILVTAPHLFEMVVNLAQFPEDRNEHNRNYEKQERDNHLLPLGRLANGSKSTPESRASSLAES